MRWRCFGIDPGATGGVAYVGSDGSANAWTLDTKDLRAVLDCLDSAPRAHATAAAIEHVWGRGGWGANTNFSLGGAFHVARNAYAIRGMEYAEVQPIVWQNAVAVEPLPPSGDARKAALIRLAELRFPHFRFRSGEADAILIALYQAHQVFGHPLR